MVLLGILFTRPQDNFSGTTNFNDLAVDSITNAGALNNAGNANVSGTLNVTGAVTYSSGLTLFGETTLGNCTTASWNPGSVASSGNIIVGLNVTSTNVTGVTGAAIGDVCFATLSSDTSSVPHTLSCTFGSNTSSTVVLQNHDTAALDITTGTLKVCYLD